MGDFNNIGIYDILYDIASKYREKEAINLGEDHLSYGEFIAYIKNVEEQLCQQLLQPLEKVAWVDHSGLFFLSIFYALAHLNAVGVPLDERATVNEWQSQCSLMDVSVLLLPPHCKEKGKVIFRLCPYIRFIGVWEIVEGQIIITPFLSRTVMYTSGDSKIGDVIILLTSGTTGKPKGVVLTHQNLLANQTSIKEYMNITSEDRLLVVKPLFHSSTFIEMITVLQAGGTLIFERWLLARGTLQLLSHKKITILCLVPTMVYEIVSTLKTRSYDIQTVRALSVSGAFIAGSALLELASLFPSAGIYHAYGLTEASPRVSALLPQDIISHTDSIGKAIPGVAVSIIGENGEKLPDKQIGEIAVIGKNVMRCYYNNYEATNYVLRSGCLFTGDYAFIDENGYIYLKGRKDNLINCGGKKIYPDEVEQILRLHPDIADVQVQGQPDNRLGQVPIALIVPISNNILDTETIKSFCSKYLAPYKIPHHFYWCEKLNYTATGKAKRVQSPLFNEIKKDEQ